jgi:hypothetical protein
MWDNGEVTKDGPDGGSIHHDPNFLCQALSAVLLLSTFTWMIPKNYINSGGVSRYWEEMWRSISLRTFRNIKGNRSVPGLSDLL